MRELRSQFEAAGLADPNLDARKLVGELLGISLEELVLKPQRLVARADAEQVRKAALQRCGRMPVHRILGRRSFFNLDLVLSPETLEPRADSETLVDTALPLVRTALSDRGSCNIVDLGTGSGAICLALLAEAPGATGVGTDISEAALETARTNALRNGLSERFSTACGDWFEAVDGRFDLIVSNPPYIRSADIASLDPEVRDFDPHAALDGGADGLDAYRLIAAGADRHLHQDGWIVVETGFDQHRAVISIFAACHFDCADRVRDLAGNDRVLVFRRHKAV